MSDVGSVYNTCAKDMKSGKICSDFAFTVVKIYTISFSEAIGDPLMCVITLATMCILFGLKSDTEQFCLHQFNPKIMQFIYN